MNEQNQQYAQDGQQYQTPQPYPEAQTYAQNQPGQPYPDQQPYPQSQPGKPGKAKIILPIIVGVVLVVGIGAGVFAWFMMNQYSLPMALAKTVSGEKLLMDYVDDTKDGNYSISGDLEISGRDVSVMLEYDYAMDVAAKETSLTASGSAMGISQRADFYMNNSAIYARFPDLLDRVFKYDYTTDKTNSPLTQLVGEQYGPKEWDKALSQYWKNMTDSKAWQEENAKCLMDFLTGLEETKLENAELTLNDKGDRVSCPGYAYKITKKDVQTLLEKLRTVAGKYMALDGEAKKALDTAWDNVNNEAEKWQTLTMTGYVYQGRFASLSFSNDERGELMKLRFMGENYPTEDMEILFGGEGGVTLEVYGSTGEKSLTRQISMVQGGAETELAHLEYIPERHKLEMTVSKEFLGTFGASDTEIELSMTTSKGASIQKISGDQVFDLAEADITDYFSLGGELQGKLGNILPFGIQ